MTWRRKRQLMYIAGIVGFFLLIGLFFYWWYKPRPNCFDGIQNQGELGVDCGGPCERVCSHEVKPLQVNWARAFEIRPGVFHLVAEGENLNRNFMVPEVDYRFLVYDNEGQRQEFTGRSFVNPSENFIIMETNVSLDIEPDQVLFEFVAHDKIDWQRDVEPLDVLRVRQGDFEVGVPTRLEATLVNKSLREIYEVEVVVLLLDADNNVYMASSTLVPGVGAMSDRNIVFTWPQEIKSNPVFVNFYPRVNRMELKR
ncbi:MAG: hypothetical protein ACOCU8_03460 [Patescibacteria group bacterium]